ncbi:hypothetical protein [Borreliella burgdorferi]|nr:hypothetical protein [Borreliella burgdorferi]
MARIVKDYKDIFLGRLQKNVAGAQAGSGGSGGKGGKPAGTGG